VLEEFEGPRYQRIAHIQRLMADGVLAYDLRHSRIGAARAVSGAQRRQAVA